MQGRKTDNEQRKIDDGSECEENASLERIKIECLVILGFSTHGSVQARIRASTYLFVGPTKSLSDILQEKSH